MMMHMVKKGLIDVGLLPSLQVVLRAEGRLPSWLHEVNEVAVQETRDVLGDILANLAASLASGWRARA